MSGPACLAAALLAATLAEPAEIRARFIGNMAFQLSDGRVTLRTDFPYESGYSGYMTWSDALVPPATGETLCLITHSHRDHFLASLAPRYCPNLVGPAEVTKALFPERARPMATEVRFGPVVIRPLATAHARLEHYSLPRGVERAALLLHGGHATWTSSAPEGTRRGVRRPWLLSSAAKAGRRIDARRIVVYHHERDESVPGIQGRELPRQGDELVFRKE